MKPYVVQNKEFIDFFCKLSPQRKKKLIPILSRDQITTISEVCKNFLRRNLTEKPEIIKKVKRAQKEIKTIALKTTPLYQKKKILQTRRGGAILSVLLPLAASIVTSLLARKS